jgi:hypothetical protein
MISREDIEDWKNSPVTEVLLKHLKEFKEQVAEVIILGGCFGSEKHPTEVIYAKEVGKIEVLNSILSDEWCEEYINKNVEDQTVFYESPYSSR